MFHKKMSVPELEKYIDDENFKFLVVKSFEMKCYGFNLKNIDQQAAANQIIQDVNNFILMVGKLQGKFPNGFMVLIHSLTLWMKNGIITVIWNIIPKNTLMMMPTKNFEYEVDDD